MSRYVTRDGQVLEWAGKGVCVCTKCEELFNSPAAFDHHLKRGRGKQNWSNPPTHDISGMPRNSKGYLVTSLRDYKGLDK